MPKVIPLMLMMVLVISPILTHAQTLYVYDDDVSTQPVPGKRPIRIIRPAAQTRTTKTTKVPYLALVQKHAATYQLPVNFVLAVMRAESAFNPRAVSRVGAKGLMQLMPVVIKAYKVKDAFDPDENIRGGCALLADLKRRHKGDVNKILGAYNAGTGNVRKKGGIPFASTRKYAKKIVRYWAHYDQILGKNPQPQATPTAPINQGGGQR